MAYSDAFYQLSGLREIALAQEMNVFGALGVEFQYMGECGGCGGGFAALHTVQPRVFMLTIALRPTLGFYIHTCTKMRYKADFHPSYLLDPVTVFLLARLITLC